MEESMGKELRFGHCSVRIEIEEVLVNTSCHLTGPAVWEKRGMLRSIIYAEHRRL